METKNEIVTRLLQLFYFNQGKSQHYEWSILQDLDMGWIDDLNKDREKERQVEIKLQLSNGSNPANCSLCLEDIASKDFGSIDFPSFNDWPVFFSSKYKEILVAGKEKIKSVIKTAGKIVEIDDLKIWLDCSDGHHYFSTRYYANGDINVAGVCDDSQYDSAETAVYVFINEYREWDKKYGKSYKMAIKLSELEALRTFSNNNEFAYCEHEDLGSIGYKHGETVKCPFCGQAAEVW